MFASLILIVAASVVGRLTLLLLTVALMSRHRKAGAGEVSLIGCVACVTEPLQPEGAVLVRGELWRARARSGEAIVSGRANVRIVGARGHLLEVEPLD